MKIGIVRANLSATGGAERYTLSLVRKLVELGHEVHAFTSALPEGVLPPHIMQQVVPHLLPAQRKKAPRFMRHRNFLEWLRQERASCRLDLLFTLERMWPSDVFRAGDGVHRAWVDVLRREAGLLRRLEIRWQPTHRYFLEAEAQVFQPENTRLVICNSEMVAGQITHYYSYPRERIKVIPNGVDMEQFHPATPEGRAELRAGHGIAPDEFVALLVGNNFWLKGVDRAVEILAQWKRMESARKLKLFVIGKGDAENQQKRAAKLGIGDAVVFPGSRSPGEVLQWYQMADVLLFPSRYDPFANACLEANACGLPVITSTSNGFHEQIRSGENGLVLDPVWDTKQMAEAVAAFAVQMPGALQVRAAVSHLTLETHVDAVLRTLQELKPE